MVAGSAPAITRRRPAAAHAGSVGPPLVTPGEHMNYKLSLQGIELATFDSGSATQRRSTASQASSSRATRRPGSAARDRRAGINIDDTFTSWVDIATGRPLRWTADEYATTAATSERTEVDFAGRAGDTVPVEFHVNDDTPKPEPQKVSLPEAWDYNAFLLALRGWEGPPAGRSPPRCCAAATCGTSR